MTARKWLVENGYEDVAELIDGLMKEWKLKGVSTRRNWWEILSGGKNGRPRTVNGVEFPVLKAAQLHEGKPITSNAICRNENEKAPEKRYLGKSKRKNKK